MVATSVPQLSQAQVEATQQAEVITRTTSFEDIDISVGKIEKRWWKLDPAGGYDQFYVRVPIEIHNSGSLDHHILIAYKPWYSDILYGEVDVKVGSTEQIPLEALIGFGDFNEGWFLLHEQPSVKLVVRLEEIDGVLRSETSRANTDWDYAFQIRDSAPVSAYGN